MFWFALLTPRPVSAVAVRLFCLTGRKYLCRREDRSLGSAGVPPAVARRGEAVEQATRLLSLSGRPARAPSSRRSRLKQASRLLHCRGILRRTSNVFGRVFERDVCPCPMCRVGHSARRARTPTLPETCRSRSRIVWRDSIFIRGEVEECRVFLIESLSASVAYLRRLSLSSAAWYRGVAVRLR